MIDNIFQKNKSKINIHISFLTILYNILIFACLMKLGYNFLNNGITIAIRLHFFSIFCFYANLFLFFYCNLNN